MRCLAGQSHEADEVLRLTRIPAAVFGRSAADRQALARRPGGLVWVQRGLKVRAGIRKFLAHAGQTAVTHALQPIPPPGGGKGVDLIPSAPVGEGKIGRRHTRSLGQQIPLMSQFFEAIRFQAPSPPSPPERSAWYSVNIEAEPGPAFRMSPVPTCTSRLLST